MMDLPQEKEMVVHVPKAMERYFYELVAGAACIIAATLVSLAMMYKVLDSQDPEWLRMIYFLVIAFSLALLVVGFRIVIDSESERPLAAKHTKREWIMDTENLTISLALLEGKERATVRKFKTGAVRLAWGDITKVVLGEGTRKFPKTEPACIEIFVENHEETLGYNVVLRVRRNLLAKQEARIIAFFREHGVAVETSAPAASMIPSSQSAG